MRTSPRTLILAVNSKLSQEIAATLAKDGIADCESSAAISAEVSAKQPYDLVFLDDDLCRPDVGASIRNVAKAAGGARVIYMTGRTRREDIQAALAAGVTDYIAKPVDPIDLLQTVRRAKMSQPRRPAAQNEPETEAKPKSRVISVFSALGGVGKTTVAINLAASLPGKKVCLVDADLQAGDVTGYLAIRPGHTLADAVRLSADRQIQGFTTPWRQYADVLARPKTIEQAGVVSAEAMGAIIKALRAQYEVIIFDVPSGFSEVALEILDRSDRILLIGAAAGIPDVRSTKVALEILRSLGHTDKVNLVLNRHGAKHGIDVRKVEETLGSRFAVKLPNDFAAATQAIRAGIPLVEGQPGNPLARELARLAGDMLADADKPAGKQSLAEKLSRIFAPRKNSSLNA